MIEIVPGADPPRPSVAPDPPPVASGANPLDLGAARMHDSPPCLPCVITQLRQLDRLIARHDVGNSVRYMQIRDLLAGALGIPPDHLAGRLAQ
jgi:hypothetical protein